MLWRFTKGLMMIDKYDWDEMENCINDIKSKGGEFLICDHNFPKMIFTLMKRIEELESTIDQLIEFINDKNIYGD